MPDTVDLAIFTIPAAMTPAAMKDCVKKGVKAGVVISAGFAETGPKGEALQKELTEIAKTGGIRFIGPNCMGFWSSEVRLNTAFMFTPKSGGISFVSQSGRICAPILDLSVKEGIGFRYFASVGSMLDVDFGEMKEHVFVGKVLASGSKYPNI